MTEPTGQRTDGRGWIGRNWGPAAGVVVLILIPIGILQYAAITRIRPHPAPCGIPNSGTRTDVGAVPTPAVATRLDTTAAGATPIRFGRDLRVKKVTLRLPLGDAVPGPRSVRIREDDFRRADDARIPPDTIRSRARIDRGELVLEVCVDRRNIAAPVGRRDDSTTSPSLDRRTRPGAQRWADPGTYSGTIRVADPRLTPATIPFTVTMSYPVWPHPVLLLYVVILIASVYLWILRRELPDDHVVLSADSLRHYGSWLRTWGGVASFVAGSIGALTAFNAAYLAVEDFGSSVPQWFGFIGAMFTAFVTVGSTPHIVASKSNATGGVTDRDVVDAPGEGEN